MAQHKASLEKTLQSTFKHKKAGTEVATAIIAVEAMVASGIEVTEMVENTDVEMVRRTRATCAHKVFGKRLADAISTMDAIIVAEALTIVPTDVVIAGVGGAPHKQNLRKVTIDESAKKNVGLAISDMVSKVEQAVDALLVEYGVGGAKEDADVEAALELIKAALAA